MSLRKFRSETHRDNNVRKVGRVGSVEYHLHLKHIHAPQGNVSTLGASDAMLSSVCI